MRLYVDTADISEWDRLMPLGMFHGITTNPLLAHRAGLSYGDIDWAEMVGRAADHGAQEFHAQVAGPVEGYVAFAETLYAQGQRLGISTVVKVPMVDTALRQMSALQALGGPILMTAVYGSKQMVTAAAFKADFIAPYFGRMIENGIDAYQELEIMARIAKKDDVVTRVLVASLRSPDQVTVLAGQGHDHFTLSPAVIDALVADENSVAAFEQFEDAAKS
jgi:transaldolase